MIKCFNGWCLNAESIDPFLDAWQSTDVPFISISYMSDHPSQEMSRHPSLLLSFESLVFNHQKKQLNLIDPTFMSLAK